MSWLSNITPPGIKKMFNRRDDTPENLWVKCPGCSDMVFHRDMEAAWNVCPSCNHHLRLSPAERLAHLFDEGAFTEIELPKADDDPLKFRDLKRYSDRLRDARKKTGRQDAMRAAHGQIGGVAAVILVQDFDFMGGSLGMSAGEGFIAAAEAAVARRAPLIVVTASGGARMQEGILSLMQMPRTTLAIQSLRAARLPYVVVLTHPTTGGVTASYAMLGDAHFAEPAALIGFAGPRVIEQTIREKLPEGFQRSEYLFEKGMIDAVVHRHELPRTIARFISVLTAGAASAADAASESARGESARRDIRPAAPVRITAPAANAVDKAAE